MAERIDLVGDMPELTAEQAARIEALPDVQITLTGFYDDRGLDPATALIGTPVLNENGDVIGHVVGTDEPADVTILIDFEDQDATAG